jgi:hypothetical protein
MTKQQKTKRVGGEEEPAKPAAAAKRSGVRPDAASIEADGRVVLQIRVRPALRREIKRSADEIGVTAQTFALMALRNYGVGVTDDDLLDLRKGENRALRGCVRNEESRLAVDPLRALCDQAAAAALRGRGPASVKTTGDSGVTVVFNVYAANRMHKSNTPNDQFRSKRVENRAYEKWRGS